MSEVIRNYNLSAAKKMLERFKYWKSHWSHVEERKIKTSKFVATLSHPPTVSEDASHDHNAPAPSAPKAVLSASVPSPECCIHSIKSLAYEAIFFKKWEFIKLNKKNLEQGALHLCKNKA
jgi:hypothetical protein